MLVNASLNLFWIDMRSSVAKCAYLFEIFDFSDVLNLERFFVPLLAIRTDNFSLVHTKYQMYFYINGL